MKKLLIAAAGIFGAIPGLAVIQSGIGAPPGYKILFGGVIEAFGTLALLILWANQNKIKRISKLRLTRMGIYLAALCFIFIALYIVVFNYCVVRHMRGIAYYPLWTTGDIADMIGRAGSRRAAIERYGIAAVIQAIDKMPRLILDITTIILLFIYQAIFTTLTLVFGLFGFHRVERKSKSPSTP